MARIPSDKPTVDPLAMEDAAAAAANVAVGTPEPAVPVTSGSTIDPRIPPTSGPVAASPEPSGYVSPQRDGRPVPETELTPEQARIRELEHALAIKQAKDLDSDNAEVEVPAEPGEDNIVIHFLADGLMALGRTWFRGQEIEFTPGSQAYKDTCDINGVSWLDLADDEFAQAEKYGQVYFRRGPWPGRGYVEEQAAEAEAKRRRAAPTLPALSAGRR